MDQSHSSKKTNQKVVVAALVLSATFATAGCSIFSRRSAQSPIVPEAQAFTTKVATNENDMPLPVEINQDIGKIAAGGNHFDGGSSGKVNVNVNVNFNGQGWQNNLPQQNGQPSSQAYNGQAYNVQTNNSQFMGPPTPGFQNRQPSSNGGGGSGSGSGGPIAAALPVGETQHRGGTEKYVVKAGDTLMKISFEKFGNVYRWREILNANQGRIANSQALVAGTELTIDGTDYVVVERNGKPYLIVRNDTLGKISKNVYGTQGFWRDLWKNNPQLIHNPNKIYAGFTLYYRDKSELGTPVNVGKADTASPSRKRLPASRKRAKPEALRAVSQPAAEALVSQPATASGFTPTAAPTEVAPGPADSAPAATGPQQFAPPVEEPAATK